MVIEFDKIKEIWEDLAVTEKAKERIKNTGIIYSEIELKRQLKDTTDSRNMIEKFSTPPIPNVEEIKDVMATAGKGVLRVQLANKKIWINHKRVKLQVAADALYPEDYDFSIIFDTVENRKKRHDMERKYTEEQIHYEE